MVYLKCHTNVATDTESDAEPNLSLKAKRERLLRQTDWIGLAPSKPVNLHCLRNREHAKISKRRKPRGKLVLNTRLVNPCEGIWPHPTGVGLAGTSAFLATQDNANHIQIQIGSNALTNTHSSQSKELVQSCPSSECMLFDQEVSRGDPESFEGLSDKTMIPSQHDMSVSSTDESLPCVSSQDRKPGPSQHPQYTNLVYGRTKSLNSDAIKDEEMPDESFIHGYPLKHRAQGMEHPLRFVFANSESVALAPPDENNTNLAQEVLPLKEPQLEYTSHDDANMGRSSCLRPPIVPIDEERPWRQFLGLSDEGSGEIALWSEANVDSSHPLRPTGSNEAFPNWSQQATVGYQTQISTPSVPSALPSFRKPVYMRPSGANLQNSSHFSNKTLQNLAQDERLWQAFVFGDNDISPSEREYNREGHRELEVSTDFGGASRYLPLSAAVSPIGPVRVQSQPRCPIDGDYDMPSFSSLSRASILCSPSLDRFMKESDDDGPSRRVARGTPFGDHSVLHASMQNNMSYNTDYESLKVFSTTGMVGSSLNQSNQRKLVSSATNKGKAQQCRSSSVYGVSERSSKGLDLIDADRF